MKQNWSYQFRPDPGPAPAEPAPKVGASKGRIGLRRRTRPRPSLLSASRQTLIFLGLTISLSVLALLYVSAHSAAAGVEYQRQRLAKEVETLRSGNLNLRYELTQAADLSRVGRFAQQAGMRPADPALESDFLFLPAASAGAAPTSAWFSRGSMLIAEIARQFSLPPLADRAEARAIPLEAAGRYANR
jgi:hypothetical protein